MWFRYVLWPSIKLSILALVLAEAMETLADGPLSGSFDEQILIGLAGTFILGLLYGTFGTKWKEGRSSEQEPVF